MSIGVRWARLCLPALAAGLSQALDGGLVRRLRRCIAATQCDPACPRIVAALGLVHESLNVIVVSARRQPSLIAAGVAVGCSPALYSLRAPSLLPTRCPPSTTPLPNPRRR